LAWSGRARARCEVGGRVRGRCIEETVQGGSEEEPWLVRVNRGVLGDGWMDRWVDRVGRQIGQRKWGHESVCSAVQCGAAFFFFLPRSPLAVPRIVKGKGPARAAAA
jgi:hypothetical protein